MLQLLAQSFDSSQSYLTDYTSSSSTTTASSGVAALLLLIIFVPILIYSVISVIGMWKMFEKAGKPGWAAIVPVYNWLIMLEIANKPTWWIVGVFISPISLIVAILVGIEIAKRFGKSETFGAIACGLLGIGYLILGFGKAQFDGSSPAQPAAPVAPASPVM